MIVFQPISYNDYLEHKVSCFQRVPFKLIQRGNFYVYLKDKDVKRIVKTEWSNSPQNNYMGFAIVYCLTEEYIDNLYKQNGYQRH